MSNKFWSRKSARYYVVSSSPSVNWTRIGTHTVPVPYPVSVTLDHANNYSENVFTNGCNVYHSGSDTSLVFGDEAGTKGGIKSGTVGEKSEPVFSDCSPTVLINGNRLSRSGDMQKMQGANTTGTIMTGEFGEGKNITDSGEFDYGFPDDMDESDAQDLYSAS